MKKCRKYVVWCLLKIYEKQKWHLKVICGTYDFLGLFGKTRKFQMYKPHFVSWISQILLIFWVKTFHENVQNNMPFYTFKKVNFAKMALMTILHWLGNVLIAAHIPVSTHPSNFEVTNHKIINYLSRSIHKTYTLSSLWLRISLQKVKIIYFGLPLATNKHPPINWFV